MKNIKKVLIKAIATFPDGEIATMEIRSDFPLQDAAVKYAGAHRRLSWHPAIACPADVTLMIRQMGKMKADGARWAIAQAGEFQIMTDGGRK